VVYLTAGLVAVGFGQLLLFWWQLALIRESLADAKISADSAKEAAVAAGKQAAVAERALTQLERPHLRFTPTHHTVEPFWYGIENDADIPMRIEAKAYFFFKNYGRYPANLVQLFFSIAVNSHPPSPESATVQNIEVPILGADHETPSFTATFGGYFDLATRRNFRQSHIWLFGKIIYGNVVGIGDEFETAFLWRYNPETKNFARFNGAGLERNRCT
jgi:hypothetical protein